MVETVFKMQATKKEHRNKITHCYNLQLCNKNQYLVTAVFIALLRSYTLLKKSHKTCGFHLYVLQQYYDKTFFFLTRNDPLILGTNYHLSTCLLYICTLNIFQANFSFWPCVSFKPEHACLQKHSLLHIHLEL